MGSLAQLPELVGFFSYSRRDDKDFRGSLVALRVEIQRELSALLAHRNFRLWQDQDAIDPGELWESKIKSAIEQSVFFIPIVTPRAVTSPHCKFEFESFLARERALGRNDLVFPVHYISVDGLLDEAERRDDPVLSIVAERQYVDWRGYRRKSVDALDFGQEIEAFCGKIVKRLRAPWLAPDERRPLEAEANRRAEGERLRLESEAKRQAAEHERLCEEALAEEQAEGEARKREEASEKRAPAKRAPAREKEESQAPPSVSPLTAAQERALNPGDSFKEGADCPEMIVVPAGRFLMGSPTDQGLVRFFMGSPAGQGDDEERPQHEVMIAKPFAVAKFALTFDEWDACASRGGCRPDVCDARSWGRGRRPVITVSWDDAQAYVKWLWASPASRIGCSPRPSTNMLRAPEAGPNIPGATTSSSKEMQWPTAAIPSGAAPKQCRSALSLRTPLVSTTWSEMSLCGRKTVGTRAIEARRPMAQHGRAVIALSASSAALTTTVMQITFAPLTGAGYGHALAAFLPASGSPGRLALNACRAVDRSASLTAPLPPGSASRGRSFLVRRRARTRPVRSRCRRTGCAPRGKSIHPPVGGRG
jgi:TIR domain/Sulfatase-modifying factor enzyme 1